MQTESREAGTRGEGNTACPSCGAALVAGMRFCRMCGYRLGEGVEEYAATQLFDRPPATAPQQPPATDQFTPRAAAWGAQPIQPLAPFQPAAPLQAPGAAGSGWNLSAACSTKRAGWWTWIIIALVLMTAAGVGAKVVRNIRGGAGGGGGNPVVVTSLIEEVDGLRTADGGGASIVGLAGPDSSWERAGLIGGDVVISFDGKQVRDERALRRIIAETPAGKTVPVVFIRDGVTLNGELTTVRKEDWREMEPINSRPGGRGVFGVDVGDRVRVPGTNYYGVELDGVNRNGPAHLAGLKEDDIIIKFNDKFIRTPGDLRLRIYEAVPGSTAHVTLIRDGVEMIIPVKVGWGRDE
ncbi:MAG TPA: PDZ domain-containing protein [Pyrinomonadaceae bacterium]|jgi:membrane-associated protease RseP (regulator of RpoE activity)|nr:PDZ domain-containing protein [Pyrinomonadaceae bacterium]